MYKQIKAYLNYYWQSDSKYQAHSPLLYQLSKFVVEPNTPVVAEAQIEAIRKQLSGDTTNIDFKEYGAGSDANKQPRKTVASIAKSSLSRLAQCRQLSRLVSAYKPKHILEMGTSLGVSALYMAKAYPQSTIHTLEGDPTVAGIAQAQFDSVQAKNIKLSLGQFENILECTLTKMQQVDMAFIDGNHKYAPTIKYFETILPYCTSSTILIFDDIHWSDEMEEAWLAIQKHKSVTMTVDLFHMGIAFLSDDIKLKRHHRLIEWRKKPWKIGLFG